MYSIIPCHFKNKIAPTCCLSGLSALIPPSAITWTVVQNTHKISTSDVNTSLHQQRNKETSRNID